VDRRIKLLAAVLVACFGLLFLQLNNLQVRQASALRSSPYAPREPGNSDPFTQPRGDILSADGVVLAYSTPTKDGYGELRRYPEGPLFADITGRYDVVDSAATGLEAYYDRYLRPHPSPSGSLSQLLTEHVGTDSIILTVSSTLQHVAEQALAPYPQGAVVAIDPRTGAILALYGKPTYDPNRFASHDPKAVHRYYESLNPTSGTSPLIDFPVAQTIAPGSTFKVVTTSALFDHARRYLTQVFPQQSALSLPETNLQLHNYAGEVCGGDLAEVLAVSCDTAYARLGLEIGAENLAREAQAFGFNQVPPIDLPAGEVAPSYFPPASSFAQNLPGVAYSAIGQENVRETALEDALVVAAIGDGGVIMAPHLLSKVIDDQGHVVASYHPHPWRRATSAATADAVRRLMLGVTAPGGTAAGVFPPGLAVAAKTGTAETGSYGCSSTWLVATAPAGAGETPRVAVAAVVPSTAGIGCSETGAQVAGPIVAKVLTAALALP
jgi:peptidoglycan glycosyltransferase